MGRRSLVVCLLGLIFWIQCTSATRDSMSQMLSSLFMEPQSMRNYRSIHEEEKNIKAKEAQSPSLESPKMESRPPQFIPPNQQSPEQFSAPPFRGPQQPNNPAGPPNFNLASGGPPRSNFNLPPGPPRGVRNVQPVFNSNTRPNGPNAFQPFPQQGPFRQSEQGLNFPPDGLSLNPNLPPNQSPQRPNSIPQNGPNPNLPPQQNQGPPNGPNHNLPPNQRPSRPDSIPSNGPNPNLPPQSNQGPQNPNLPPQPNQGPQNPNLPPNQRPSRPDSIPPNGPNPNLPPNQRPPRPNSIPPNGPNPNLPQSPDSIPPNGPNQDPTNRLNPNLGPPRPDLIPPPNPNLPPNQRPPQLGSIPLQNGPNPNLPPNQSPTRPDDSILPPNPNLPPNSHILKDQEELDGISDENNKSEDKLNEDVVSEVPQSPIRTEPPIASFPPQREAQFFSRPPPPRFPPRQFLPGPPFRGRAPQRRPRRPMGMPPPPLSSLDIAEDFLFPPKRPQCVGVNGSMIGECGDPFACEESGGKPVGPCPAQSGSPQVCCSFVSFCNFMTNVERAYLSSPNYPEPVSQLESCAFQLSPLEDVCQVRIDFLDFHLKPPSNGVCDDDNALHIESNDPNAFIPVKKICGTLSEDDVDPLSEDVPHMYVHFKVNDDGLDVSSEKSPPKRLRYLNKPENLLAFNIRVRDTKSSWNIRLNQISCGGGARQESPFGCAQYFTGESGRLKTLNQRDGNYLKNMDWRTCIKPDPEACGISYNVEGGSSLGEVPDGVHFGLDCLGDYMQFSGQKAGVCGSFVSNTSLAFESDQGPLSLHFHSDSRFHHQKDVGYALNYEHLYNCRDTPFFDYNQFSI